MVPHIAKEVVLQWRSKTDKGALSGQSPKVEPPRWETASAVRGWLKGQQGHQLLPEELRSWVWGTWAPVKIGIVVMHGSKASLSPSLRLNLSLPRPS